jgi:plastocyanin
MNSRRAAWLSGIAIAVVVAFILMAGGQKGLASPGGPSPTSIEVKIDNFTFAPGTLTIAAGTTVVWTNSDDVPHTVVSDDKTIFKSRALDTGEKFSYTFTKPGKYDYFCSVHPKMTAEVVVQ